ncbi:MAG TPA: NAD(P)H-binding protein, partial [bacterium]|nr:NAD(P)H-binding protein [bacterium]
MRALVTGASGFTGGYMVDHLVERGCQVRAFVRPTSNTAFLKAKGVDIFTGDLFYKADLAQAMRNIDVVYHIAALYREANQPDQAYW